MISVSPSCIKHLNQHTWVWDRTQIPQISPFFELLSPDHEGYQSFHLLQSQIAIPACQKHDPHVGLQTGLVTKTRTTEREIRWMAVSRYPGVHREFYTGRQHTQSAKAPSKQPLLFEQLPLAWQLLAANRITAVKFNNSFFFSFVHLNVCFFHSDNKCQNDFPSCSSAHGNTLWDSNHLLWSDKHFNRFSITRKHSCCWKM